MKLLLSSVCTAALLLSAAACGGNSGGGGDGPAPNNNGDANPDGNGNGDGGGNGGAGDNGNGGGANGGGGGGNGGGGGANGTGVVPLTCEQIWTTILATKKVGLMSATETTMSFSGMQLKFKNRMTVIANGADSYTEKTEASAIPAGPTDPRIDEKTHTKAEFLETCDPDRDPTTPDGDYQIVEQKDEDVTVPAGTFATHFVHGRSTSDASGEATVTNLRMWTLKSAYGIAAKTSSTSAKAATPDTIGMTSESVLVELTIP